LYKQATEGDNTRGNIILNVAKPNFYEMEASAKYSAWEKCKGMSKFEAKELYIKHANLYDESVGERLLSGE
jgi:acyl-CoA-binding protein